MAELFTIEGINWLADVITGDIDSEVTTIAVGTGSTTPLRTDTELENEVYRTNTSNSNCSIRPTSNDGEMAFTINISGGTEVPDQTEITEFALFTDESTPRMVYREVTSGRLITEGDRVGFELTCSAIDA
ncbi:hypothetical protein [Halosegnis longus]|uniref:hypothetical protein n=1 Tax=Halosegnis longus TaxID=2216012 RepID=UPI00129D4D14|nr:hypothetical protein [Halosegnis longus]